MWFDVVLLDIDGTLYDYEMCHQLALSQAVEAIAKQSGCSQIQALEIYERSKHATKTELGSTASSHNRIIYFTKLARELDLKPYFAYELNEVYWNSFLTLIKPYEGVKDLIGFFKSLKIKICALTNFQSDIQFKKLERLGILKQIDEVITSEEVGVEKPNRFMFERALSLTNCLASRTVMIGDDFDSDITGGHKSGLSTFLISRNEHATLPPNCAQFKTIDLLLNWLERIYEAEKELVTISKSIGTRFDLIQAGGGNISIKLNDLLLIKSSGLALSQLTHQYGISYVSQPQLRRDIDKGMFRSPLTDYQLFGQLRPSIETYMHALLDRIVVHVHPVSLLGLLTKMQPFDLLSEHFEDAIFVPYFTPGIAICEALKFFDLTKRIIFLQNHGLIVHGSSISSVRSDLAAVERVLSDLIPSFSQDRFINAEKIAVTLFKITGLFPFVRSVTDPDIYANFMEEEIITHSFPDSAVYLGRKILKIEEIIESDFRKYIETEGLPTVVMFKETIFIIADSSNQARDVEDILRIKLWIDKINGVNCKLSENEIDSLINWEAEKYRRKIGSKSS
jgi:FMN phosphatase YigB (HAD superfamily)/ribulose-5-phosphate 4-epimerase/fuculose-1-phosphate aldolase